MVSTNLDPRDSGTHSETDPTSYSMSWPLALHFSTRQMPYLLCFESFVWLTKPHLVLGTTLNGIELRCEVKHIHGAGPHLPASGDTVAVFLACARIGAIHSVVFTGFSAESLRDRVAHAHHQRRG
ncbi:hypothetical protein B0H14DRAFT_3465434 [Mycena olivaceomarginata]|nr:hypothetical protein B0H14DRAFT_3465434 [Mycena olivaceomarginata]